MMKRRFLLAALCAATLSPLAAALPAQLVVEVNATRNQGGASIQWGTPKAGGWSLSSGNSSSGSTQSVMVQDGMSASISFGEERAVPWWIGGDGGAVQQAVRGFWVTPTLTGANSVRLSVAVDDSRFAGDGQVQGRRLVTEISAPLGQWVTVGRFSDQAGGARVFVFGAEVASSGGGSEIRLRVLRALT
ncbi:type II and III secretion system protein [Crenobacter caeni]|uniref:Type II and III secretion system protein n=1 Tax=Crenobacter caeni TaxID=2705474 RepID=A0A6B2KRP7_9NEIS|nr:type II and III secretion system protein [Crenobacter caeni]NDV12770.1 type II and III secretion system protein [Crenobacter caeni]